MKSPDFISKIISSIAVSMLFLNILLSGYITSFLDGQISEANFSISQSLAFGNKISLIILFVIALLLTGYLIFHRKQSTDITIINTILLVIICAFFITIIFITTYRNANQHYIFSSIIFSCLVAFVTLNAVSLWKGIPDKKIYQKVLILILPIVLYLSLFGLSIGLYFFITDKQQHVFPSFENIVFVLSGLSILEMGFI